MQQTQQLKGRERELWQRDGQHLEIARKIVLEEGFRHLTIGRLAKITGFSRATFYQRFGCKEGLVFELGIRCQRELVKIMSEASRFPGRSRERMMAVGEAFNHYSTRFTDNMRILAVISSQTIIEKTSERQQALAVELDTQMFRILQGIVEDAIVDGDLVMPEGTRPQTLCFGLWVMIDGWTSAVRGSAPLREVDIANPMGELLESAHRMLDGFGWRPLTEEWDYDTTRRRIHATLFPDSTLDVPAEQTG
ncbi:MAG: TetR family transcriptional regulator [Nitrospiraceae bacterium]|nr:TetR family transcriptional regulator [Nitrospiraceae bacterium]